MEDETTIILPYVKKIVELERELDALRQTRKVRPANCAVKTESKLTRALQEITSLQTRLDTAQSLLRESQTTAERLAAEIKTTQEENLRLTQTVRQKDEEIQELHSELSLSAVRTGFELTKEYEEATKQQFARIASLQIDLQDVKCSNLHLQQRIFQLEGQSFPGPERNLSLSFPVSIAIVGRLPPLSVTVAKEALCGVQEDFIGLHRRYKRLRDENNIEEEAAVAMGKVRELQEKLEKAKNLVSQLRGDVETLTGWRVDLYGDTVLLTMKYSNTSLELVRNSPGQSPAYRLAPSLLMRQSLADPSAAHHLTHSKSFPAFLACILLTFVESSHSELQF